jgi:hypothetical protein
MREIAPAHGPTSPRVAQIPVLGHGDWVDPRHELVARAFVAAFNSRDRAAWVCVFHPDAKFRPTALVGARSLYEGHEGVVRFLDELAERKVAHQARIRRLHTIAGDKFVLLTDVLEADQIVSPGATMVSLAGERIIEATAYLTDEQLLETLGIIPQP